MNTRTDQIHSMTHVSHSSGQSVLVKFNETVANISDDAVQVVLGVRAVMMDRQGILTRTKITFPLATRLGQPPLVIQ